MTGEFVTAGRLGGYVSGGDPNTYYPDLWSWLVDRHDIDSVIDIGCGDLAAVSYFTEMGVYAVGVDGVPQPSDAMIVHDFETGPLGLPYHVRTVVPFDLAWSCEFVEHVEERFIPNFMQTFQYAKLVLMTHALPGQPGWHHVNCQPPEYWIDVFAQSGFVLDENLTEEARKFALFNPSPTNYFVETGMAFRA